VQFAQNCFAKSYASAIFFCGGKIATFIFKMFGPFLVHFIGGGRRIFFNNP